MKRLLLIAMVVGLATCALGKDFEAGFAAAERGDYAAALKEWRPLARRGDADAQYNLGVMYDNGYGVAQDYGQAVAWYGRAAEQGLAEAQYSLGSMYREGMGVTQDHGQAVKWTRLAAEQGFVDAQNNLGVMYYEGEGLPRDCTAAEQGDANAQHRLGVLYANGQGVSQNFVQSYKWLTLAASQVTSRLRTTAKSSPST